MFKSVPSKLQANIFRALANETRIEILRLLLQVDVSGLRSGDIALRLGIGSSAASHHLYILRKIQLVDFNKTKSGRYYTLNTKKQINLSIFNIII